MAWHLPVLSGIASLEECTCLNRISGGVYSSFTILGAATMNGGLGPCTLSELLLCYRDIDILRNKRYVNAYEIH